MRYNVQVKTKQNIKGVFQKLNEQLYKYLQTQLTKTTLLLYRRKVGQILSWNFYSEIAQFLRIRKTFGYLTIDHSCRLWCSVILRTSLCAYQFKKIITCMNRRHES